MKRVTTLAIFVLALIFIGFFVDSMKNVVQNEVVFQNQSVKSVQYDLSTISGREIASASKDLSPYKTQKCTTIKHTDGTPLTFCIAEFDGTTSGFYNPDKELMVVSSFSQYTLIHEITHATTLHYYRKGFTDMNSVEVQEKIAYNAENLLMQIQAFKEDYGLLTTKPKQKTVAKTQVKKELASK